MDDGQWHHLAGVFHAAPAESAELWFDGELVSSIASSSGTFLRGFDEGLFLANFPIGLRTDRFDYETQAALDEVVVFRRPLLASEVVGLYRRGAGRAFLQVRVCADAASCASTPWRGPGGLETTRFAGAPPAAASVELGGGPALIGRAFQLRVIFDRLSLRVEPRVSAVGLVAAPP
ncbi:MAG: hypothetical protein A2138_17660 [Deltaproteobacteria bacterium RBG_16_71_12]|nr:MAG: hypothetical protein A2138_17660 [Deltaproteobacteria bacterium RBG_16_71_12]